MCTDESPASQFPQVLHDFEPAVEIVLEPVDSVVVTTLMDNVTDIFMPDQGPALRASPVGEVTVIGPGAGPQLAGQGVLSDIIAIARHGAARRG